MICDVYWDRSSYPPERITARWTTRDDWTMNVQRSYEEPEVIIKPNYKKENYRKLYWK